MLPLDLLDRAVNWPFRELRGLPPNRMRLRVGVQNRLLFNGVQYLRTPIDCWLGAFARGHVGLDSTIVDLGCGCGRFAMPLRDMSFYGQRFRGSYIGVDVDGEMLGWCRRQFPAQRFRWIEVSMRTRTYGRESGERRALDIEPGSADFVVANSLFSHLLEEDFAWYLRESARVLRPGGWLYFTAFALGETRSGGRWTFGHGMGAARVESLRYPEAAVAYERGWIEQRCAEAGFERVRGKGSGAQMLFRCRRALGGRPGS